MASRLMMRLLPYVFIIFQLSESKTVEPVVRLMGKARLHKDLPIFKALKGALKLTPKQRNRTLIGINFLTDCLILYWRYHF